MRFLTTLIVVSKESFYYEFAELMIKEFSLHNIIVSEFIQLEADISDEGLSSLVAGLSLKNQIKSIISLLPFYDHENSSGSLGYRFLKYFNERYKNEVGNSTAILNTISGATDTATKLTSLVGVDVVFKYISIAVDLLTLLH